MEGKLAANRHKGDRPGWLHLNWTLGEARDKLAEELGELAEALDRGDPSEHVREEAADAANILLMIADHYSYLWSDSYRRDFPLNGPPVVAAEAVAPLAAEVERLREERDKEDMGMAVRVFELDYDEGSAEISLPWAQVLRRVRQDLRSAAADMSIAEVRFLVDQYYTIQDFRIQATGQSRALDASGEPHLTTTFVGDGLVWIEDSIKAVMDRYTRSEPTGMGAWARGVVGIGPVLSAGLLANVNVDIAHTAGQVWSFAGLNPEATWEKGQKRPWNARLKVLAYKIGESFVKVQNNKNDIYGKLYKARKGYEQAKNDAGDYADQAKEKLQRFKIGKDTDAYGWYSKGMLPPAHIHARARRWTVKLFLSHYHEAAYFVRHHRLPPLPYPVVHLGHAHVIDLPNPDLIPGLVEARRNRPR